uniref:Uncharacterized protein n=1 Tax=Avena sativa TaxID=4498 RepID=A0ACD5VA56_AVESA
MSSLKFDLPQLDYTTRFSLWQVKMRAILAETSDLDEALDGFGEKDAKTWSAEEKRKDRKALSLIQLHLSNNILQEVLEMKSAAALWGKLETICMSKDLTSKMHVKMKLFSHRLQEGGSVMNHLSLFREIISDLQSMEVKYDDEDLALLLLCSLPSSYTHFRDTMLLSREKITLDEVQDALKQREKMKSMVQADGASSKAEALQNKEKRNGTYQPKDKDQGNGKAAVVSDSSDGECLAVFAACASRDDEWILDTACSFHICCNKDWFSSYESVQTGDFVRVGNDNPCHIVGVGSVKIRTHDGVTRTLSEVKHIPSMARNLISLSTMDVDGYKYAGGHRVLKVSKGSLIHMIGDMNSAKLYVLRGSTLPGIAAAVTSNDSDDCGKTHLWHMRLGHMSEQGMAELVKRELIDDCNLSKYEFCEHCIFGKHKRVKFNASVHTTKGILDYVHADVWGPSRKTSIGGANYMLTIIDDYSRKVWPYFLKHKSDVFDAFKKWKVMVEKQTEKKVKVLRTDNGMEFCSNEFEEFCSNDGMIRHHTIPYTPQQNGVAERMNRTIISRARCMLSNAGMHRRFWAEAANTACYLINRSPSIPLEKKTPIEVWSGSPADYSQLRVFGCTAYAHVDNGKLEPRAVKCIFLGYGSGVKAYKLWNPETKRILLSRNVVFNESVMYHDSLPSDPSPVAIGEEGVRVQVEHLQKTVDNNVVVDDTHEENIDDDVVQHSPTVLQQPQESIAADRPRRNIVPPRRLIEECNLVHYALSCAEQVENDSEPATYNEAIASVDREKWVSAMQEEMQSLEKNGTWDVVRLPKQKKAVRCKWIFKKKEGLSPKEPSRYKARLVAKGFSQIPGIDYNDVFSPVVKHSSIRTFFSIVAMRDLELEQLDVKTAFLHGELDEEIYMDQPEGFIVPGKEDFVCKLKKSLYGLKQSPRQWYKRFDSFMISHGFERSKYDSCVYIKFVDGSPIYLLLYVDDMLIAAKGMKEITTLKAHLSSEFEMKDLGAAKKILGMEITRDRKSGLLFLSQQSYIKKVLHRFNMDGANSVSTPIAPHFKLSVSQCPTTDEEFEYMSKVPYSSAVGSLMYLLGTSNACLKFGRTGEGLVGYVDSDFAADLDKRRSLTGYVFNVGGCAVSWKATLQAVVAQSTTEAEYMAIAEACKESVWLKVGDYVDEIECDVLPLEDDHIKSDVELVVHKEKVCKAKPKSALAKVQDGEHDAQCNNVDIAPVMPVDDKTMELVSDKPVEVHPLIAERKDVAACVQKVVCVDTGVQTDDSCAPDVPVHVVQRGITHLMPSHAKKVHVQQPRVPTRVEKKKTITPRSKLVWRRKEV